jgi:TolA-binding protein
VHKQRVGERQSIGRKTRWTIFKVIKMKTSRHALLRFAILLGVVASFAVLPIAAAQAQRGGTVANLEGRLNELQRSVANLNAQLERLKAQDRRLQQQMEEMQTKFGQRLERLEKGKAADPVPRAGTGAPKRQGK